ncbi:single-stranded DNA-binding protein [Loktanella sp. Alg231-35]|uniref:single-stranded DNA-binding protein n=1 Tax=Loktanella sp. Alg231-35 TaxID=1922220 RepID=UPI000D550CA2|nr:single-stranded DNA-binding protein [Loktanella sp. Alg231-35]
MRTFAEFQIIGRVGKTKVVGNTLRISIAAEYGRKDDKGEFQSKPYWNEVTLFNENVIKWAKENVQTGDIVHARGTLRQTQWENNSGGTEYGMTLAAEDFDDFTHDERRRAAANNS